MAYRWLQLRILRVAVRTGLNPWITGRVWGPSINFVAAQAQAEFDWNLAGPNLQPRTFWHRLRIESIGRTYPLAPLCNSALDGQPVAGPV